MESQSILLMVAWSFSGITGFVITLMKRDNRNMEFWPKMSLYAFLPLELIASIFSGPIGLIGAIFREGIRYCPHCRNCIRKYQTVCVYCHRDA